MALNQQTIQNLSWLARLKLPAEREGKILNDLQSILDWVEQLKQVDIEGVEPLVSVTQGIAPMRQDVVTEGGQQADLMANAPESVQGFYVVPKVVE
ncbi:MAG: Asp-tRNA(Asn)/Glu-tRNA(Gln) amidotransferase subunit GatC [Alphaproteobacteria bacterium]|nr:Asp-tRNA(Asn)/Glu-tRNA(Gln) amidotransferase subunit GatC [Alphaproteobacteria bacterium]